jgi:hypothetical protein
VNHAFSLDKYLGASFDLHNYNCWHFACDVWHDLTGIRHHTSIEDFRVGSLNRIAADTSDTLVKLSEAVSPCFVLMQRRMATPHIGVYYNEKVLHLNERGAAYAPLSVVIAGFQTVNYYR